MRLETFGVSRAGRDVFVRRWADEGASKATVQISHGVAEHGGRYEQFAKALTEAGYVVYASDHRGHGPACPAADLAFFAETGGWRACLDDLSAVADNIAEREPGLPRVFFGHSMGSFFGQTFIAERGATLAAAVLSGTAGAPPAILPLGRLVTRFERWRLGARGKSPIVQTLMMGELNKDFRPARTPFDWLSRDEAEVDKYVNDPLCGFEITNALALDLIEGISGLASLATAQRIPKDLPIYLVKGARCSVGKRLDALVDIYRQAGLARVTVKIYPDARHETLNEINRDEVTADLIGWLGANIRGR